MSETSITHENGNATKKPKLHEKDKELSKDKKLDGNVRKESTIVGSNDLAKEIVNKEEKTTTVKDMLRAQRDANMMKSSSHANKRSKSSSSATSDDSSSSESDSSETSSDANPSRHSDDDVFDQVMNSKGLENKITDNTSATNLLNKIQVNGTVSSENIPQEANNKFMDSLNGKSRDLISKLVELSKNLKENLFHSGSTQALDLLYEYVQINYIQFIHI